MSIFRAQVRPAMTGSVVSVAVLVLAAAAHAQTPAPDPPPVTAPAPAPQAASAAAPYWALIGGYERDTYGASYGFFGPAYVHPIRTNLAWTARAFGNYLTYEFSELTTTTEVSSPGANGALGLQFGERHTFTISAGPAVAWRKTKTTSASGNEFTVSDTRWGWNVGAEAYVNPTPKTNFQTLVNYNTTDDYLWSRAALKQQVSSGSSTAVALGIEGIAQGNDDIRSLQGGGLLEIAHTPSNFSLTFRGGYKRSTFDQAPSLSGPYFGVGFYLRLH